MAFVGVSSQFSGVTVVYISRAEVLPEFFLILLMLLLSFVLIFYAYVA